MPMMWAPARFELLGQPDIVFEAVLGAVGIEDVAGVAEGALAELARLAHRVHRDAHVLDPVEAVEDAEEVDAALGRLAHEEADGVVGVVGVADGVGAAEKHLEEDVGRLLADVGEALPRVLGQEAHGDVEGRPAPAFEREEAGQGARIGLGHGDEVVAPHAGGEQRLVGVAHGGVGDEHALLVPHPAGEGVGAVRVEPLLGAERRPARRTPAAAPPARPPAAAAGRGCRGGR